MHSDWRLLRQLLLMELRSLMRARYVKYAFLGQHLVLGFFVLALRQEEVRDNTVALLFASLIAAQPVAMLAMVPFSKDGAFLAGLMTRRLSLEQYLHGKILSMLLYAGAVYVCILPLLNVCPPAVKTAFAASAVYHTGLAGKLLMYLGCFDTFRLNLNAGPLQMQSRFSAAKMLAFLPVFVPFFFPPSVAHAGLAVMGVLGLAGFVMHKHLARLLVQNLARRKYALLSSTY